MKGNRQNIHELTRIEAFLLSEKAGHPSHMHDYFWAQAEAIVRQRVAIVEVAVKASGGKSLQTAKSKAKLAEQKAKKTPDAQLPLGDEPSSPKPVPLSLKPKAVAPTRKKAVASVKAEAKKSAKSK